MIEYVWLFSYMVLMLYIYNIIYAIWLSNRPAVMRNAFLVVVSLVLNFFLIWQKNYVGTLTDLPLSVLYILFFVVLLMLIGALSDVRRMRRWQKHHISGLSIKESVDNLPVGLCFYMENGLIKLINTRMQTIGALLGKAYLSDGAQFWEALKEGRLPGCVQAGEQPIYQLDSGNVCSFRRFLLDTGDGAVYELMASDVTEEYALTASLQEKKRQADYVNARLKALLGTMEYLVMERELLELKVSLHDHVGKCLLLAKRYLAAEGSVDRDELIRLWDENLRVLLAEQPEFWQKPYFVSCKQAKLLGVDVTIDGTLPVDRELLGIVETAITVQVTNTLRHAQGAKVWIKARREEACHVITFTNDGQKPSGEIRETGGLANLRREVEAVGGSMSVRGKPCFEMELRLPRRKNSAMDIGQ